MENNTRRAIVDKARLVYGLVGVLKDDISRAREYSTRYKFIDLYMTLKEAKETMQVISDNLTELEYTLYLAEKEREESH